MTHKISMTEKNYYGDLGSGNTFFFEDEFYIVTTEFSAVMISTGEFVIFDSTVEIFPAVFHMQALV